MKIGIDTFGCDHGRSGLGAYLMSVISTLPKNTELEYELFGSEMDRYTYTGETGIDYTSVNLPDTLGAERIWHSFNSNGFGKKRGYDIMLYTAGSRMICSKSKIPSVAIVNDIVSSVFSSSDWISKVLLRKGLNNASCIIAASNYIKKDLIKLGIKNKNIEVIHNGINHSMFFASESSVGNAEIVDIKPFAIKRPYFIYASRMIGPEKKHIELIKAFTLFKEKTHLPHRLVIAGAESRYSEEVHKAVFTSSAASDIFLTGYFPHESFPELYRNAEACVFPSVNEGVGLPVLESMACGIPVACSSSGALPEIAGNNALYFNSDNIEEIEQCLEKLVGDEALRKKLIDGGLEWASRYSWEKTISKTLEVIKNTVKV